MIKLKVDNSYTEIRGMSKECEMKIFEKLSFTVEEFNSPYLKIRHLYNRKTKKTYTGLLNQILEIFDERGEDYEIIDVRTKWESNANFKLVDFIDKEKTIPLKIRPYQQEIINVCRDRDILCCATGAGKTFIMAGLIEKFNVKPVAVFADKIGLCEQLRDEFEKFLGVKVGLVGGGYNEKQDITVYSIQSAKEEDVEDAKMVMIDECLEYNQKVLMADGSYKKIGDLVEEKSNEEVISYNHKTNTFEPKKIINHSKTPIKQNNKKLMRITIKDSNGKLKTITCTDNHKIWVEELREYIEAKKIKLNYSMLMKNSNIGKVVNIEYINFDENMEVYDIEIEDNHNFICEDILVHNCHHIASNTFVSTLNLCKNAYYRIGVSATPWRDAGDELLLDAMLSNRRPEYDISASKLIDLGYLVPCNINIVPITGNIKGKNYQKVYKDAIVNNNYRNRVIVEIIYNLYKRRGTETLVLVKMIEHGNILLDMINKVIPDKTIEVEVEDKNGKIAKIEVHNVEFISGSDDSIKRRAVIKAAREGKMDVIISSTIGDEGLDIPALTNLILCGGGRSSNKIFQRIGRVLRLYPGKTRATVFDFDDRTNKMLQNHTKTRIKYYKTEPRWTLKSFNVKLGKHK